MTDIEALEAREVEAYGALSKLLTRGTTTFLLFPEYEAVRDYAEAVRATERAKFALAEAAQAHTEELVSALCRKWASSGFGGTAEAAQRELRADIEAIFEHRKARRSE